MSGRLGSPESRSALLSNELASSDRRSCCMVLSSNDRDLWCLPPVLTYHASVYNGHAMPVRENFGIASM